jgi:O-succinylbenzoic acid--CoA ligase
VAAEPAARTGSTPWTDDRKNAFVTQVPGAVEAVDAPASPEEVRRFLPRLSRALSGGAPLMTVAPDGPERDLLVRGLGRNAVPWDTALVVPTSGSTGAPRLAVLSRAALATSADLTHAALGGPGRWLLALPTTRIAGLQVLVRSLRAGKEPAVLDTGMPFTARRFAAAVAALDADAAEHPHYSALVPTQLQRLLDDGEGTEALWQLDAVLVGGASVAPALLDRARGAGVTVVCTYGMTETCGGCVYDGAPLDGVSVDVDDSGRIRLRGPVLFDGYLGDTDVAVDGGWFTTSDLGRIDAGVLRVDGRADNVVVSGGVKVPAESVERLLLGLPDVSHAVVVGVPDPEWGERVTAVVCGTSDVDATLVRAELGGEMPAAWLPRDVVHVESLPVLRSGKVDRDAARRIAADLAR